MKQTSGIKPATLVCNFTFISTSTGETKAGLWALRGKEAAAVTAGRDPRATGLIKNLGNLASRENRDADLVAPK